ncbi:MAG: CPBP family glutamic-type intramembrane protease [Phycisphaerales bacterium]|nr:MAG: CPBP family intramembrane metalloprotease [Phycisphaerales bacterium]
MGLWDSLGISWRFVEYVLLFFAIPAAAALRFEKPPVWILIWTSSLTCLVLLLLDKTFDRDRLFNSKEIAPAVPRIVGVWVVAAAALTWLVSEFHRQHLFNFPTSKPWLWMLVMVAYPILSVYPQSIVYRTFIFHRYQSVFPSRWGMIWASAISFSFAHVIFHNWIALGLTAIGGILFAHTYTRTRSTLASAIEHALYGCWVFTVGLGSALYHGTVQ